MSRTLLKVTIDHDCDTENPCDCDGWQLYSFSNRHLRFKSPDEIHAKYSIGLNSKLRHGTAFWLGYHEHGLCQWALSGEQWNDPWDSVSRAGILIWEQEVSNLGPKTYEDRKQDARNFLETYTDWCNGACYWYSIEKCEVADDWEGDPEDDLANSQWEDVDSCGGFIGDKWIAEAVQEAIKNAGLTNPELAIVEGDGKYIKDYHDLMPEEEEDK